MPKRRLVVTSRCATPESCTMRLNRNAAPSAHTMRQRLVDVCCKTARAIGAQVTAEIHKGMKLWRLAFQFDNAARRAAPKLHSRGAFKHVDLFVVEGVAVVAAEVANAVEKDIVFNGKTTDSQVIPLQRALARR